MSHLLVAVALHLLELCLQCLLRCCVCAAGCLHTLLSSPARRPANPPPPYSSSLMHQSCNGKQLWMQLRGACEALRPSTADCSKPEPPACAAGSAVSDMQRRGGKSYRCALHSGWRTQCVCPSNAMPSRCLRQRAHFGPCAQMHILFLWQHQIPTTQFSPATTRQCAAAAVFKSCQTQGSDSLGVQAAAAAHAMLSVRRGMTAARRGVFGCGAT